MRNNLVENSSIFSKISLSAKSYVLNIFNVHINLFFKNIIKIRNDFSFNLYMQT